MEMDDGTKNVAERILNLKGGDIFGIMYLNFNIFFGNLGHDVGIFIFR